MWRLAVRLLMLMSIAVLFIIQQVFSPLVTVWIALGEYLHCVSYVLLLDLIVANRGLKGLSVKTQVCFLFVHWFRYVDSFFTTHYNHWIFSLKIFYMVVSALLVLSLICLRNTWEKKKDTCSLVVLFFLSILLGSINYFADGIRPQSLSEKAFHFFWIISHYLQGFAMLPQFVFCYRDPDNKDVLLTSYILVLGTYRLAYAINWIERAYKENFFYISGPLGLGILLLFLGDFLLYKIKSKSFISSLVLKIDDTIDASQQPLLQAVYGGRYERLSLAELAASSSSSSSARSLAPVEIDLRNVHVVGRPRIDVISGMSTTANSPVVDSLEEEEEETSKAEKKKQKKKIIEDEREGKRSYGASAAAGEERRGGREAREKEAREEEGEDTRETRKPSTKKKHEKSAIPRREEQDNAGGSYTNPPLYRLNQDTEDEEEEEENQLFGIGEDEEEEDHPEVSRGGERLDPQSRPRSSAVNKREEGRSGEGVLVEV